MEPDLSELVQRAEAASAANDGETADRLFALLYHELHRLAEHHLRRGGPTMTLGSTTLLHEVYLSVSGREREGVVFPDRSRFYAYASRAMRTLVVDYARRRHAQKRGRELKITLVGDEPPTAAAMKASEELERLGDALEELGATDPALASLVDMHFFCGLTFSEIATIRGVSEKTVQRDWRKARMLLHSALTP